MPLPTRGLFTRFAVLVAIVAALHALVWALMGTTTLRVDPERWISFLGICAIMAAAGFIALSILRMEVLGSILLLLALGYAVGRAAIMLTYVVYDLGRDLPPWDVRGGARRCGAWDSTGPTCSPGSMPTRPSPTCSPPAIWPSFPSSRSSSSSWRWLPASARRKWCSSPG